MRPYPAVLVLLAALASFAGCGAAPTAGGGEVVGAAAAEPQAFPDPPDGTRWVGTGQVVVAVPDWWTTGETRCAAPVEDTVYADSTAVVDCFDPVASAEVPEVSALAVIDAGSAYAEMLLGQMEPAGEVDGHPVLERPGCERWFPGVCRRVLAVPDEDAVLAVTIAEEGDGSHAAIRDSLRVLPEAMTTVPIATTAGRTPTWGAEPAVVRDLVAALRRGGLQVALERVPPPDPAETQGLVADLPVGALLGTEPALGSVVERGATVTVSVMGR
ncbi:hypothetical protein [Nocardioides sp. AX2bis]|uniref:hypothetical protein n=1 Tax=Nocardioides sp. AX2bis TaxID=2653157 RepID=UPI0012EF45C7|nr:hypothetical protein [Nocardioides sp. AX2bis]VXC58312.1 conserved exported hypothetical protein [Nocardioides sp. AX2bis]